MRTELSFITINYNGLDDTCALIDSIPTHEEWLEVIVVDNASTHDEASILAQRYPRVKVVRSQQNMGFARGNNIGIKAAQGQYLFFINNDTVLLGSTEEKIASLRKLIQRLGSTDSIGMLCTKIRFFWGAHPLQYAGSTPLSAITLRNSTIGFGEEDYGQYDTPHPTPYAHGAAMLARRDAIEKVGLMPECYFLYYEELDWSVMFSRAGYEIWYDPACTVYHKESQTTGQGSPLRTYYITRNRLIFAQRNQTGIKKILTYGYLTLLVGMRDAFKYLLQKKPLLSKASLLGISDFFKGIQGYKSFNKK